MNLTEQYLQEIEARASTGIDRQNPYMRERKEAMERVCEVDVPALVQEVRRLRENEEQIHEALDYANRCRAKCHSHSELGVSNGLALGRIALITEHKFEDDRPNEAEEG